MKCLIYLLPLSFYANICFAQSINIEYDKKRDFTQYKTFSIGESQIITPADQKKIKDAVLHGWIVEGITTLLNSKGLSRRDSLPDLIVTYTEGSLPKTENQKFGTQLVSGISPGSSKFEDRQYQYTETSFMVDLNERNGNLIWRIDSKIVMTAAETENVLKSILHKGFKKFPKRNKPKAK